MPSDGPCAAIKSATLGGPSKRTAFAGEGDLDRGVVLLRNVRVTTRPTFITATRSAFAGKTVAGGFSTTNPPAGGFGAWVQEHSLEFNGSKLTPRHASFVAAVLVHEGVARHSLKGSAVYLHF